MALNNAFHVRSRRTSLILTARLFCVLAFKYSTFVCIGRTHHAAMKVDQSQRSNAGLTKRLSEDTGERKVQ